jgi:hypothetical protein
MMLGGGVFVDFIRLIVTLIEILFLSVLFSFVILINILFSMLILSSSLLGYTTSQSFSENKINENEREKQLKLVFSLRSILHLNQLFCN